MISTYNSFGFESHLAPSAADIAEEQRQQELMWVAYVNEMLTALRARVEADGSTETTGRVARPSPSVVKSTAGDTDAEKGNDAASADADTKGVNDGSSDASPTMLLREAWMGARRCL